MGDRRMAVSGLRTALAHIKTWVKADKFVTNMVRGAVVLCIPLCLTDFSLTGNYATFACDAVPTLIELTMLRWPRGGAIALSALGILYGCFDVPTVFGFFGTYMFACLIWGYVEKSFWRSTLLPLAVIAVMIISGAFATKYSLATLIMMLAFMMLPWMAGRSIRLQITARHNLQAQYDLERVKERLNQRHREQELALAIHDSVTNDLSTILLIAQSDESGIIDTSESLALIVKRAKHALNEAHHVIDLLEHGDSKRAALQMGDSGKDAISDLKSLCAAEDAKLSEFDIAGQTTIIGDAPLGSSCLQFAQEVLQELYANIKRHCAPHSDEYSLILRTDIDGIRIAQTNTCDEKKHPMAGVRGGRGLQLHKERIERVGGHLWSNLESGTWTVNIWIPATYSDNA